MSIRSLTVCFSILFLLVLSSTARAEMFTAYLNGAQEVPAVATNATGYARFHVNESAGSCSFTVVFNNLSSTQTAAHVHAPAPIGANAAVAINIGAVGGQSGTITGTCTINPTQLSQVRNGQGYINVHTTNFPGGEIRGQLQKTRVVDYDGDGRTDYSILRFPNVAPPGVAPIAWWNLNSTTGTSVQSDWGNANTDFPAPGDYDGDGRTDLAVYRSAGVAGGQNDYWIIQSATFTYAHFAWGIQGDQTVQRDYDGDGKTDVAVFRFGATATSPTTWFIRNSATGTVTIESFGLSGNGTTSGDFPIPGDYDGDGKFDLAVYRFGQSPANHYIYKQSSNGIIAYRSFGNFNTDYILPGDYDGDGKWEIAAARTGATGTSPLGWWIEQSSTNSARTITWGISSDLPAQGDYDGDGRTDVAIYRRGATASAQSAYWVRRSFDNGTSIVPWGVGADFSVNTFDIR